MGKANKKKKKKKKKKCRREGLPDKVCDYKV